MATFVAATLRVRLCAVPSDWEAGHRLVLCGTRAQPALSTPGGIALFSGASAAEVSLLSRLWAANQARRLRSSLRSSFRRSLSSFLAEASCGRRARAAPRHRGRRRRRRRAALAGVGFRRGRRAPPRLHSLALGTRAAVYRHNDAARPVLRAGLRNTPPRRAAPPSAVCRKRPVRPDRTKSALRARWNGGVRHKPRRTCIFGSSSRRPVPRSAASRYPQLGCCVVCEPSPGCAGEERGPGFVCVACAGSRRRLCRLNSRGL